MRTHAVPILVSLLSAGAATRGDDVLYQYEGDVLPHDASAGWIIFDPCEPPCTESLEPGHFLLFWPVAGDIANYAFRIAEPEDPPPPTLWVEWRFRSNNPKGPFFDSCDATFIVDFAGNSEFVKLYGDFASNFAGSQVLTGLALDEWHTYRYESLDGINYRISVNGRVFIVDAQNTPNGFHTLQFGGRGGCASEWVPNMANRWGYIRYGTISFGERIVSTDPPQGFLDPEVYAGLDRFTVTFDAANYVYLDEISVTTSGGVPPPVVLQTRRGDDSPTDTVEILLDRPLPAEQETRFTFNDGTTTNEVVYNLGPPPPPIPATSSWGMIALALVILVTAAIAFRPRVPLLRLFL